MTKCAQGFCSNKVITSIDRLFLRFVERTLVSMLYQPGLVEVSTFTPGEGLREAGRRRSIEMKLDTMPDAKTAEDRTQQIIRGVRSGDLAERVMRLAQLLGAKLRARGRTAGCRCVTASARCPRAAPSARKWRSRARKASWVFSSAPTSSRIAWRSRSTPAPVFADNQISALPSMVLRRAWTPARSILLRTTTRGSVGCSLATIAVSPHAAALARR